MNIGLFLFVLGADTIWVLIPLAALSIPIIAIVLGSFSKIAEIKYKAGRQNNEDVVQDLQDIKRQLVELRDTTTRYDVSFDAALQRMESRVGSVETRIGNMEREQSSVRIQQ